MVPQNSPTSINVTYPAGVAAYRIVALHLQNRIRGGEFTTGRLPTLPELVTQYRRSQTTVQRALDLLKDQQQIEYRKGRGHYLRTAPVDRPRHVPVAIFSG